MLWVALKLGLTSFGGPIAHLGYFERSYVRKRRWLSNEQYGQLVSLCQILPGPTSSQVGLLVGLHRAGWKGAVAAWCGFTLPSALLMYLFAILAPAVPGPRMQAGLHGLMLSAVAVVAQAVWSMARSLAPDFPRRAIALVACLALLLMPAALTQYAILAGGAVAGAVLCQSAVHTTRNLPPRLNTRSGCIAFGIFLALLIGLSSTLAFATRGPLAFASIFYRCGTFVFGGGHVVLPLLQQALVPTGWVSDGRFLAGYGLVQAMPGPLFTFAAYLGASGAPQHQSLLWALLALISIFLPGLLLAVTGLSLLDRVANNKMANAMLAGINAAVVGLLAAALYNPVWIAAVRSGLDVVAVLVAFALLARLKIPPVLIVVLCVGASIVESIILE